MPVLYVNDALSILVLSTKKRYSIEFNVYYFKIFVIHNFLGKFGPQNLKFSKLTEIWYGDALLYPYFEFDVYFLKVFVIHIFMGKFGPKIWSSPN